MHYRTYLNWCHAYGVPDEEIFDIESFTPSMEMYSFHHNLPNNGKFKDNTILFMCNNRTYASNTVQSAIKPKLNIAVIIANENSIDLVKSRAPLVSSSIIVQDYRIKVLADPDTGKKHALTPEIIIWKNRKDYIESEFFTIENENMLPLISVDDADIRSYNIEYEKPIESGDIVTFVVRPIRFSQTRLVVSKIEDK